ncbi:PadR family transcriptional regulator [Microtetraspora niveoalba]|uniref:PadR family transcriptional regulator n=1 Tax=Microtetraspora niveoalba TaxID=46175 RepID=UPI0008323729|nr:PadR family transcriptional regulator [Microtetraspora niveoalba]
MSPVFGHGRLRLYLLKLLEESPRHGYEVIRLLQDRFLGVYSPSPGTIYPRLARLEEEGLVTHEVVDGKKVFTLTDKGREELNNRLDELAELEQEITASVQDIAREVKEDVRQTVRSLRQELTQMAKDINQAGKRESREARQDQKDEWRRQRQQQREEWRQQKEEWKRHKQQWRVEAERWQREWDRIWAETWALSGPPPSHGRADAEFGQMLADFVARVQREAAQQGEVTAHALEECRSILDEAAARIRDTLRP